MNLVAIRMSSMGDVALTLPALRSVLDHYPEHTITLVTRPQFTPFFGEIPRLSVVEADVRGTHRGVAGLRRLYRMLRKQHAPDAVIDLHDVLRSRILSAFFRMDGIPVYRMDKGRGAKKRLTARRHKQRVPLTHTVDRYLHAFRQAGLAAPLADRSNWFAAAQRPERFLADHGLNRRAAPWVGIAPFARHREKRWPLEKTEALLGVLDKGGIRTFLFGGGAEETAAMEALAGRYPGAVTVAGLTLAEELGLIATLDLMVTMDSANMHLASLSGIPVVSIWGATHPFAGFSPLGDNGRGIVQISTDRLSCRPCSVFGNKPCFRKDHACMEWITPTEVLAAITGMLERNPPPAR